MVILEGTDGVGKTATIEKLKKYGIECFDRSKDVISKNMLFTIKMKDRVKIYEDYLNELDGIIIFLINNDKDELMDRILSRKEIGAFDLDAPLYNKLYLDTFNYMKKWNKLYDKLYLIDCTHLSLDEQVRKVCEVINAKYSSSYGMC